MGAYEARLSRSRFYTVAPRAVSSLLGLAEQAVELGLDKGLLKLVKLRVSQINGCAFCVQYHLSVARKLGVPAVKLDLVDRERASLAWAEALPSIAGNGAPDDVYRQARAIFSETELAGLSAAVAAINGWNRIAVGFRFAPDIPDAGHREGGVMALAIRPLAQHDRAAWEPLWAGYLAFYKTSVPKETTETTWSRFHDQGEPMHALGAFDGEKLVGIVHFLFHRSTWTPGNYCYLQDLFTAPEARGKGAGRALIEAVYERARGEGASRVYWLTQNENATARALYDQVADHPGFTVYRKVF